MSSLKVNLQSPIDDQPLGTAYKTLSFTGIIILDLRETNTKVTDSGGTLCNFLNQAYKKNNYNLLIKLKVINKCTSVRLKPGPEMSNLILQFKVKLVSSLLGDRSNDDP